MIDLRDAYRVISLKVSSEGDPALFELCAYTRDGVQVGHVLSPGPEGTLKVFLPLDTRKSLWVPREHDSSRCSIRQMEWK